MPKPMKMVAKTLLPMMSFEFEMNQSCCTARWLFNVNDRFAFEVDGELLYIYTAQLDTHRYRLCSKWYSFKECQVRGSQGLFMAERKVGH